MRFDVRHLELLLAVERARSISGAARLLGIDQPQVTRQLRRIEEELGYAVFERTGNGTRPTEPGTAALSRARTAVRTFYKVDARGSGAPAGALHVLYHEIDPTPVVLALREVSDGAVVTTAACSDAAAGVDELRSGGATALVALRLAHDPWPVPYPLVETQIITDLPVVFVRPDHPLADGDAELDLADLAAADWITGGSADVERLLRHECRRLGGFEPRTAYRCGEEALIRGLADRGFGVVYGLRSVRWAPGLVARRYRDASPAHWMLVHRPDVLSSRAAAAVSEAMRARYDRPSAPVGAYR